MNHGVAFVTGASSGFGTAIVRRLAARGLRVVAAARRGERLIALAGEFASGTVLPLVLDVRLRDSVERAVAELPLGFTDVTVLVNNAGLALGLEAAPQADLDDWDQMIDTNCAGLVYVTRALLPGMVERSQGLIINIGSVAGSYPYPGGNVYGATKAFVHQFSLNLRSDLHGTGVRVTCVEPGICGGTEFSRVRLKGDESKAAQVYVGMQPLTGEDIADTIEWVWSRPRHVDVNTIELMPTDQSFAPFQIHRVATAQG